MDKSSVKLEVIRIIQSITNAELIAEKTGNGEGLEEIYMDSISFISMIVELEEFFGVKIPDEKIIMENFKRVDEIVDLIYSAMNDENV